MILCVAACCSVLQCVAVWCSVLQCVAVCCSVLQCVAVCLVTCSDCNSSCNSTTRDQGKINREAKHTQSEFARNNRERASKIQSTKGKVQSVVARNSFPGKHRRSSCMTAVCCNVLQFVTVCCSVLQCVAVCCNVLQCVAV